MFLSFLGLFYQTLLTAGNVMGDGAGRRGGKTAKDRMTVGLFWNATGKDFYKPVFIGKAKKPRCFGNHWTPAKIGAFYYNNDTSWMRSDIWTDVLRHFNRYCYHLSNGGKNPVILLADNCKAHCVLPEAKPWKKGDLTGFLLKNVHVIFFQPNCTSHVQPLDVGCIQTSKALYRKRHMSWILEQLAKTPDGTRPQLRANVRQAMEWFMMALVETSVDVVKNCWVATKILTPAMNQELATGLRHNNRVARDESLANPKACVPESVIDELSTMLTNLGKSLSTDPNQPVAMIDAVDMLDLPMEREVFDPPVLSAEEVDAQEAAAQETPDESASGNDAVDPVDPNMIALEDVDVDDLEPSSKPVTLEEGRAAVETLFAFLTENAEGVERATPSGFNALFSVDTVRFALQRMCTSAATRQQSIRRYFRRAAAPPPSTEDVDSEDVDIGVVEDLDVDLNEL